MTAWDAVPRQHGPVVFRIALRIVGHTTDAEDVCHEVFCKAYKFQRSKVVENSASLI
jgi:DNA-directed RNA polymerase specialized sigma24 family protein